MRKKEEILKEFLSPDRQSSIGYIPITAEVLKLELLADIRDEQNERLDKIIRLLFALGKEIEHFERIKK